eukprot:762000-Hanusia_phi.AAC.4
MIFAFPLAGSLSTGGVSEYRGGWYFMRGGWKLPKATPSFWPGGWGGRGPLSCAVDLHHIRRE